MTVLSVQGVTKSYPGGVTALADVSLAIELGELVAVVGASGSGKSTLLSIMGTLDRPTSGTVHVDGVRTDSLGDRALSDLRARRLGFVFQQSFLDPRLTAVENAATGLLYAGVPRRRRTTLATAALERVGLAHRHDLLPHELSGGERQRVGIARAVVTGPSLVLADEPTGALDTVSGAAVMRLFGELRADGTTIAVITHDRQIAAALPRQVHVQDGRVVEDRRTA